MNLHWTIETLILVVISVAYLRYVLFVFERYWSQGKKLATYITMFLSTVCFVLWMFIINDSFNDSRTEHVTPTVHKHKHKGVLV